MLRSRYRGHMNSPPSKDCPTIAAIDLGTNSCRLLIAKVEGQAFQVIDSFSRVVRLGESVHTTNRLTEAAIQRTIEALRICQEKIENNKVCHLRAVTTEACRRAENSDDLVKRALNELGLSIDIISAEEEARLALSGCAGVLNSRIPFALAFDIGGGSTEVMWLRINEPRRLHRRRFPVIEVIDCISLPYGVVTLCDRYNNQSYDLDIYNEIRHEVAKLLTEFSQRNNIPATMARQKVQMIGTSGTVTTLAAISLNLERYDRRMIDGVSLEISDIHRMCAEIFALNQEQRAHHPCIGAGRTDLVVMGTGILEGICDTWPVPSLRVADRGVREGILMELVKEMYPSKSVHPRFVKK
ncbi:Ppx/GppA phosphatase family protein [Candidatus Odyssella acanthamoebae]|uniref:Exopolyphosphatase n=1 Tax=Candidatus Odyssella acanthamoebae TaxID=91604 RepID=A0A077AWR5_9PROT|nr:Ppx/GppA phosphatase family protein [Candidatus Paracaedibacter acanthamoebae]AIK96088.1 exopolyphosphatase [Candidatus Paracaedibacter acanthamoebae]